MNSMSKKLTDKIGETSIKVAEIAQIGCFLFGLYEPKFPIELLKKDEE